MHYLLQVFIYLVSELQHLTQSAVLAPHAYNTVHTLGLIVLTSSSLALL